jgi:YfiH family protein
MARELARRSLPSGRTARVVMSEAADGDMAVGGPDDLLADRRSTLVPGSWTWLDQVHGTSVVEVRECGDGAGSTADAAVTVAGNAPIAIQVADCVPVALLGSDGIAVVHAGWRGLRDGVLEQASRALSAITDGPFEAVVGPHIGACCYAFGESDLDEMAELLSPMVRGLTRDSRSSLDLATGVEHVLRTLDTTVAVVDGTCTSCDERYWSYRNTGTTQRQAMVAWIQPGAG